MQVMNPIDRLLNGITMYRLVLYGLLVISAAAGLFSLVGILSYPILSLIGSAATLIAAAFVTQQSLVRIFAAAPGASSWLITTQILFLILKPAETPSEYVMLALAAVIAMASKYVLAVFNRHVFNPAAVGLVVLGLLGSSSLFWWVGSGVLLPLVTVVGLLVVRKVRRFHQFLPFLATAILTYLVSRSGAMDWAGIWSDVVVSGPLIFFGTIMLTEPATSPPTRRWRMTYGAIVGVLYSLSFHVGPIFSSPELALVLGNLFSYMVSYKRRIQLKLARSTPQGRGVYEFAFAAPQPIGHVPGQYLEWTLPHAHPDNRGNRRYFTIASAPEETEVKLGVRVDPIHSSSFKKALLALRPGSTIWASQLGGDFTLPSDQKLPLVFIAGGIGVTPFRSMVSHLTASGEKRDITLFYTAVGADDFSYQSLFNQAAEYGLNTRYVITGPDIPPGWSGQTGYITADMIRREAPRYAESWFYLSGPGAMVDSYKSVLRQLGVPRRHIKTDYFPGF